MFTNIVLAQGLKQASTIMGDIAGQAGAATYSKPQELIGTGINAALAVVGLIFLILMIYAGYLWLTSHGEEESIKKAQKIIASSVIGFILVVSAYAITVFVGKRFEVGGGGEEGKTGCQCDGVWVEGISNQTLCSYLATVEPSLWEAKYQACSWNNGNICKCDGLTITGIEAKEVCEFLPNIDSTWTDYKKCELK